MRCPNTHDSLYIVPGLDTCLVYSAQTQVGREKDLGETETRACARENKIDLKT